MIQKAMQESMREEEQRKEYEAKKKMHEEMKIK
jgi:hypothetical protein